MSEKRSRRHHTIPEMYQVRFASNPNAKTPQAEVFDMDKGEWRTQAIRKTAVRRDYYSVTIPKGHPDLSPDEVEKWLSQIEGAAASILKKKIDRHKALGPDERWMLGLFVATSRMRNPFIRDRIGTFVADIGEKIAAEKCQKETGQAISGLTPEDLDPRNFKIKADDQSLIGVSFSHVIKIANFLAHMQWSVFQAPSGMRFLTCDNPYFEVNPKSRSWHDQAGLFNPDIEITVPLSSTQFLFISHQKTKGGMYRMASEKQWKTLNYRVFLSMQNFIITHSRNFNAQEELLMTWIRQGAKKKIIGRKSKMKPE